MIYAEIEVICVVATFDLGIFSQYKKGEEKIMCVTIPWVKYECDFCTWVPVWDPCWYFQLLYCVKSAVTMGHFLLLNHWIIFYTWWRIYRSKAFLYHQPSRIIIATETPPKYSSTTIPDFRECVLTSLWDYQGRGLQNEIRYDMIYLRIFHEEFSYILLFMITVMTFVSPVVYI